MDRRQFLTGVGTAGGLVLLGGGFWARQAYARGRLSQELLDKSEPFLTTKARKELEELPVIAREDMRRYFDGVCLNVNPFAAEVCSADFADTIRQMSRKDAQHQFVVQEFARHTGMTEAQLLDRVGSVAGKIGQELDGNWTTCCGDLAKDWNLVIKNYNVSVTGSELTERMTPLIENGLHEAMQQARKAGLKPILSGATIDAGKAALLLMAASDKPGYEGMPAFAADTLHSVFESFLLRVRDRSGEVQRAVTDRIAAAGNKMSLEFQKEVRARIQELHKWQKQAVTEAANREAEQLIRII